MSYDYIELPCPRFQIFRFRSIWDIVLILILCGIVYFIYSNRSVMYKQPTLPNKDLKMEGLGYREFDEDLIEDDDQK